MTETNMTKKEREAFLALPWIGIISIPEAGRGPLTVPVWYLYKPGGDICIWTGAKTRKGLLLNNTRRISFCVQDPKPPYKYVSIEGPVSIGPIDYDDIVRPMALRYFGPTHGEAYLASIGGEAGVAGDLLVNLRPERWLTVDYSKLNIST